MRTGVSSLKWGKKPSGGGSGHPYCDKFSNEGNSVPLPSSFLPVCSALNWACMVDYLWCGVAIVEQGNRHALFSLLSLNPHKDDRNARGPRLILGPYRRLELMEDCSCFPCSHPARFSSHSNLVRRLRSASMVSRTAGQVPLLLVEVSTKRLQQFTKNEPPYAALSLAAWNSDEDTDTKARFDDLTFVATASFDLACSLAETHHYDWLWVDSVQYARARANDKGQNETINSLIHWYRRAETCFVHLPDLPPRCSATDKTAWGGCSWFRPLFALPALIASKTLTFYDREGNPRGDKSCLELLSTISNVTKIPQDVLRNAEQLPQMCAFRKCALVASRVTTDAQDYLYVLASLFDIRQPHHTEDDDPFHQLQAEIVRVRAGDLSLLAWESHYLSSAFHGVFADSVSTFVSLPSKIVLATYRFDSIQTCEPSWGQNWRVSAKCYDTDGGDFFMELGMTETGDRMGIRLRDLGGVCFRRHPYRLVNISQDMKGTMRVVELKTIGTPREGDLHSTELAQTVHTKRRYKESPTPEEQCFRIPVVAKSPAASRTDCTTARGSKRTKHHSVLAGDGLHMTQVELGMQTPRTNQGHDSDDDDDFSAAASSQEVLALEDGHPFLDAMDDILKAAIDEVSVELV